MFDFDPNTIMAAVLMTAVAVSVVLVIAMVLMGSFESRCKARHSGYRCVHELEHSGSHRDEYGTFWNDRKDEA